MLRPWFKNKQALVVGLGRSGIAAAQLLKDLGASVSITDRRPRPALTEELHRLRADIPVEVGSHSWLLKKRFDLVVVSPGVHWDLPELKILRRRKIPVMNELGLALKLVRPRAIAAITGTNGKTTTTTLLTEMMKQNGGSVVEAGNIGTPLSSVVSKIKPRTTLILEVSSYQLESLEDFKPQVACLLNITPDHLERHKTMNRYAAAKFNLFRNQRTDQWALLNADDPWCRQGACDCPGRILWLSSLHDLPGQTYATPERLIVDDLSPPLSLPHPRHLIGPHNIFNALAAAACAVKLGVQPAAIVRALRSFRGVPHRLEQVARINGVLYINDSKSTNVDSTEVALRSFKAPILLILGGQHKGSPYTPLIPLVQGRVKRVFLIGESAVLIKKDLGNRVPLENTGNLARAVERAHAEAIRGDVVLLSPACASFDQFKNFEDRGQAFKELVLKRHS